VAARGALVGAGARRHADFDPRWITFLSATGAVFITFLAGAKLDSAVLRTKWRETGVVGLVSVTVPFLGCAAYAHYVPRHRAVPPQEYAR
jgi:Kef-type K+ transport system membrane component KefB